MIDPDCVFCRIISGKLPAHILHRDEWTVSFLDISPVGPGHALLVPRHHAESLHDLPAELGGRLMEGLSLLSSALVEALGAGGFNVFLNNGAVAGQIVSHVHFHVLPRFPGDGVNFHPTHRKLPEEQMRRIQRQVAGLIGPGKG